MWEIARMWLIVRLLRRHGPIQKLRQSTYVARQSLEQIGKYNDLSKDDFDWLSRFAGLSHNRETFDEPIMSKSSLIEEYIYCFWYGRDTIKKQIESASYVRLQDVARGAIDMAEQEPYRLIEEEIRGEGKGMVFVRLTSAGRKFGIFRMLGYMFLELEPFREGLHKWGATASVYKQLGVGAGLTFVVGLVLRAFGIL